MLPTAAMNSPSVTTCSTLRIACSPKASSPVRGQAAGSALAIDCCPASRTSFQRRLDGRKPGPPPRVSGTPFAYRLYLRLPAVIWMRAHLCRTPAAAEAPGHAPGPFGIKIFTAERGGHPPRPPSPPSRPNRMSDGPDDRVDGVLESRGDEQIAVATADAAGYAAASLCCRVSCRSRLP